ncbi:leucine zipper domain-containing protein [Streptomyces sp. NPDC051217]|uniref:leucine zipper domain-containing protein n=1 Tax=Streptomyces sp. NPDC051217 TaxID=3365644 RepID=UPI0037B1A386
MPGPGYGVSRQCYYIWLRRFEAEGLEGLEGLKDRSSAPHHTDRPTVRGPRRRGQRERPSVSLGRAPGLSRSPHKPGSSSPRPARCPWTPSRRRSEGYSEPRMRDSY